MASSVTVFASDLFSRTLGQHLGQRRPTGGAYTLQGTAADYAVSSGVGTMTLASAGATRSAPGRRVSARRCRPQLPRRADKVAARRQPVHVYGMVRRSTPPTSTASSCAWRPTARSSSSASTVVNNVETLIGSEVTGARPDLHRRRLHSLARAGQRHQPDDAPHARLGRRHHRADDLAVHRHQQRRRIAGRRRCGLRAYLGAAPPTPRSWSRSTTWSRSRSRRELRPGDPRARPSRRNAGLNGSGIVGAS